MNEAYRDALALCPACTRPMERRMAQEAEVDVCGECRGLWIDWFDGDTWTVAQGAAPLSTRAPVALPEGAACPRCRAALLAARHEATGPFVLRCSDCYGTFVPRGSLQELLDFTPPGAQGAEAPRSRFVEWLKQLLGL